jgi:hypothetical protein
VYNNHSHFATDAAGAAAAGAEYVRVGYLGPSLFQGFEPFPDVMTGDQVVANEVAEAFAAFQAEPTMNVEPNMVRSMALSLSKALDIIDAVGE